MRRTRILNGRSVNGLVKSIQRGTIALTAGAVTNTATILTVDVNNAVVITGGYVGTDVSTGAPAPGIVEGTVVLTNATTVTATRGAGAGSPFGNTSDSTTLRYTVVEYWPGVARSCGTGRFTVGSGATSATQTIPAVDVSRTVLYHNGMELNSAAQISLGQAAVDIALTNGTTITATRNASGNAAAVAYAYVEFL